MAGKLMITANEIAEELGISSTYAYKIIRQLNAELAKKGYITITGKVNRKYLEERLYGMSDETVKGA